jgi:hypothetical protein
MTTKRKLIICSIESTPLTAVVYGNFRSRVSFHYTRASLRQANGSFVISLRIHQNEGRRKINLNLISYFSFCVREYCVCSELKVFHSFIFWWLTKNFWCIPNLVISTVLSCKWKNRSPCFWGDRDGWQPHLYDGVGWRGSRRRASRRCWRQFLRIQYVIQGTMKTWTFYTNHSPFGISGGGAPHCYRGRSSKF